MLTASGALTLFVGQQEGQLKTDMLVVVILLVVSVVIGAVSIFFCCSRIQNGLTFWYHLPHCTISRLLKRIRMLTDCLFVCLLCV